MLLQTLTKRICPYVQDPSRDCYCFRLGSQDIEKAVYYCNENFKICDMYKARYIRLNPEHAESIQPQSII